MTFGALLAAFVVLMMPDSSTPSVQVESISKTIELVAYRLDGTTLELDILVRPYEGGNLTVGFPEISRRIYHIEGEEGLYLSKIDLEELGTGDLCLQVECRHRDPQGLWTSEVFDLDLLTCEGSKLAISLNTLLDTEYATVRIEGIAIEGPIVTIDLYSQPKANYSRVDFEVCVQGDSGKWYCEDRDENLFWENQRIEPSRQVEIVALKSPENLNSLTISLMVVYFDTILEEGIISNGSRISKGQNEFLVEPFVYQGKDLVKVSTSNAISYMYYPVLYMADAGRFIALETRNVPKSVSISRDLYLRFSKDVDRIIEVYENRGIYLNRGDFYDKAFLLMEEAYIDVAVINYMTRSIYYAHPNIVEYAEQPFYILAPFQSDFLEEEVTIELE